MTNVIQKIPRDRVDMTLKRWAHERDDLDTSAKAIVGRVIRFQAVILEHISKTFKKFKINPGEYAVLCNLRTHGHPYQMTPKQIIQSMLLTSGGMSNLLARMEKKQLITRISDTDDRRRVFVVLTQKGKEIIDGAMAAHVKTELELVNILEHHERTQLEALLKRLLTHLDPI